MRCRTSISLLCLAARGEYVTAPTDTVGGLAGNYTDTYQPGGRRSQ